MLKIKVKSGSVPVRYTEDGLLFNDGSELQADVVVFTTGFARNHRDQVKATFGTEVAAKVEDLYGLNEEGELLGAFKPMERKWITHVKHILNAAVMAP